MHHRSLTTFALLAATLALADRGVTCVRRARAASPTQPVLFLQLNATQFRVYVPGYFSVASAASQVYCACGLSLPTNPVITKVGVAEVIDPVTGAPLTTSGTLYTFRANSTAAAGFKAAAGGDWTGFLASVTRPVPPDHPVWLGFDLDVQPTATVADLDAIFRAARVGTDEADARGTLNRGPLFHVVQTQGGAPSCPLYFKFDRASGDFAINYGQGGAPQTGAMRRGSNAGPWTGGRFGAGALRGSSNLSAAEFNYCDTGWRGGFGGSFTVSWWMRERIAVGTQLSYLWGGMGGFRCVTNGVANQTLWVRSWSSSSFNIELPTIGGRDLQTMARGAAGVFVALCVDGVNRKAQWYIDGLVHGGAINLPGAALVPPSTNSFTIGRHNSDTSTSAYDIDEFVFCAAVAPPAVLKAWAMAPTAATAAFGSACGIHLGAGGGPPVVGNNALVHTIEGPANLRYLLVAGMRTTTGFDMGIAFAGLAGCRWYPSFDLQLVGASGTGVVSLPGGIPKLAALAGTFVDLQVLGFVGTGPGRPLQSNAISQRIELN